MKIGTVISALLLAVFTCHCSDTDGVSVYPPVDLGRWERDSTYFTLDGEPAVLLGFVAPAGTLDTQSVTSLIERVYLAGGNYLGVSTRGVSDSTSRSWRNRAGKYGVVLDTLNGGMPLAGVSRGASDFNLAVLAGSPAQAFGTLTQTGLNAIRGIRLVERYLRFQDLAVDTTLLAGDRPPATLAARDSLGNYLIHVGGEGQVTVRFADAAQVPRRVTVIGYLGTQRSETLVPPYGRTFTLISREVRGGWMLITPLAD